MPHWFLHFFGLDSASGPAYLAWSGIGSDITELAIIGGLVGIYRKHNCHEPRCWRIGRVHVDDKGTLSCFRHHPEGKPQRGHILRAHRDAQADAVKAAARVMAAARNAPKGAAK